jgi:hypothetical protein
VQLSRSRCSPSSALFAGTLGTVFMEGTVHQVRQPGDYLYPVSYIISLDAVSERHPVTAETE